MAGSSGMYKKTKVCPVEIYSYWMPLPIMYEKSRRVTIAVASALDAS